MSVATSLCSSFQDLAEQTWGRLGAARKLGLTWSEVTNTETILLTLQERHADQIFIRSFGSADEALNGADWEWWVGKPGQWLPMRVQGKRIHKPGTSFRRLQTYRARSQSTYQIDNLISRSKAEKMNPAYCFYVNSSLVPKLVISSCQLLSQLVPCALFGCAIGHAQAIKRTGSNMLADLFPMLIPWHWLVCPGPAVGRSGGIADLALAALRESLERGLGAVEDAAPDDDPILFEPTAALPDYMQYLFEAGTEGGGDLSELMRLSEAVERQVRGLMLVRGDVAT